MCLWSVCRVRLSVIIRQRGGIACERIIQTKYKNTMLPLMAATNIIIINYEIQCYNGQCLPAWKNYNGLTSPADQARTGRDAWLCRYDCCKWRIDYLSRCKYYVRQSRRPENNNNNIIWISTPPLLLHGKCERLWYSRQCEHELRSLTIAADDAEARSNATVTGCAAAGCAAQWKATVCALYADIVIIY